MNMAKQTIIPANILGFTFESILNGEVDENNTLRHALNRYIVEKRMRFATGDVVHTLPPDVERDLIGVFVYLNNGKQREFIGLSYTHSIDYGAIPKPVMFSLQERRPDWWMGLFGRGHQINPDKDVRKMVYSKLKWGIPTGDFKYKHHHCFVTIGGKEYLVIDNKHHRQCRNPPGVSNDLPHIECEACSNRIEMKLATFDDWNENVKWNYVPGSELDDEFEMKYTAFTGRCVWVLSKEEVIKAKRDPNAVRRPTLMDHYRTAAMYEA